MEGFPAVCHGRSIGKEPLGRSNDRAGRILQKPTHLDGPLDIDRHVEQLLGDTAADCDDVHREGVVVGDVPVQHLRGGRIRQRHGGLRG